MLTTIALIQHNAAGSILITWTQGLYTLPALIFTLLAGACADCFPPKILLLSAQGLMLFTNLCLVMLNGDELWLIGGLSLLAGISSAWRNPVWQSLIGSLVPAHCLSEAIGLSSVNFNLARILGPLLASLFILWLPLDKVFALCAVLSLLFMWQVNTLEIALPQQETRITLWPLIRSTLTGFIHVYRRKEIKHIALKTYWLSFASCTILLMIPIMAEETLNSAFYTGLYLAFFGLGGIGIVFIAPVLRRLYQGTTLLTAALFLQLFCLLNSAFFHGLPITLLMVTLSGASWILLLTTLNATMQHLAPAGSRGRSLSLYITCLSGGISSGALFWGLLAKYVHIDSTLFISAGGLTVVILGHIRLSQSGRT